MSRSTKIFSKSGVAAVALLAGLSFGIPQAEAQSCDPPGAALGAANGTIVPSIISNALNVVTGIQNTIGTSCSFGSGLTGGNLITCMQSFFAQHSQTVTNGATMTNSVIAKGQDYQATSAFALHLQGMQAQMAIANGQGTNSSSNSMQYQNNALCVPATQATGAAQATVGVNSVMVKQAAYHTAGNTGPGSPTDVTKNPPNAAEALAPKVSSVTRVNELFNSASLFIAGTLTSNGGPCADSQNIFGLDTSPDRLLCQLAWNQQQQQADVQYINYIIGTAPEVPPFTPGASGTPASGQQATLAQREKVAFMMTAALGPKEEYAYRSPFTNAAGTSVAAMYTGVNQALNFTGPGISSGQASKALLLDALYRQPLEQPNTMVGYASLVGDKALQFIAAEMLLSNYLNYERYNVERKILDVNSAQLAIAYRGFNFQGQP